MKYDVCNKILVKVKVLYCLNCFRFGVKLYCLYLFDLLPLISNWKKER